MTTQTPTPTRSPRRRWLLAIGIGVAVIAVAAVVYTVFTPAPTPTAGAGGGPGAPVSLTATSATGEQVTVPGGGKPSVLLFFSAGCGTCGPAAHTTAAAQAAAPQAANYVAVDMDPAEPPATITAFLRANQAGDLAVTSDHSGTLTSTYGVTQLSTAVTLNPAGQVVTRAVEPDTAGIEAALTQARTP